MQKKAATHSLLSIIKKASLVLALFLLPIPAHAIAYVDLGCDRPLSSFTSVTAAIPATSTTVTLTGPSRHMIIRSVGTSSAAISVNFNGGAATTSNFTIDAGGTLALEALPNITTFTIIGATATGNYSVLAW